MASGAPTFDQLLARTPEPRAHAVHDSAWRSWESWVTFTIVLFVQLPVVGSLQSSDWVDEMPNLMLPAFAGLLLAWHLGHTRLRGTTAAAIAAGVGTLLVTVLVLRTMELANPTSSGISGRWSEFRLRLLEWVRAIFEDGISTDPLPFVVMLTAAVFLVGFISTWAVARWRNPWIALIPGGFVLLTNISYLPGQPSFSFVLFLIAAIVLVARLTFLQSVAVWRSQGVEPREGMSVEVLLVGAVVAGTLIVAAWLIPTANNFGPAADLWGRAFAPVTERVDALGRLFLGVGSKKPIPVHMMDAVLPLQGQVALDQAVLYEVTAPGEMNLRGAVYDEYTGSGWQVSSASAVPLVGTTVEAAQLGTPSSRAQVREAVRVDVSVVHDTAPGNVLLSVGGPIASDQDANLVIDGAEGPLQLRPDSPVHNGDTYSTVGTRSVAAVETLAAAGQDYPAAIVERYLQVPEDLPPRVRDLALSVAGNAAHPYEAAQLIEAHLRENYAFTFEIEAPPPGADAVDHFLFESKAGYFDLYASSMAVMLRTIGIPSRVAVGFALDDSDFNDATEAYAVTEEAAWAWPEVYFPGFGWVEFNPSPSRDLLVRPGDDSEAREIAESEISAFDAPLDELFAELPSDGSSAPLDIEATRDTESPWVGFFARVIGWLLLASTVLLVILLAARFVWNRLFRHLDVAARRWAKVQLLANLAGLGAAPERTPGEFATDLGARIGQTEGLRALAASFTRSRYGSQHDTNEAAESSDEATALDGHYRSVRGTLVRLALRRLTRLGRVQGGPLARRDLAGRPAR